MRIIGILLLSLITGQNKSYTLLGSPGKPLTTTLFQSFSEDFESGTKASYTAGTVTLSTGEWFFNNALIGTIESDKKNDNKSVRIRNVGSVRMNFDNTEGASTISVKHAAFGTDGSSTWELQISTDGGSSFSKVGSTITTSSSNLQEAIFSVNVSGNIRIAIVKTGGGTNRINIDDVIINPVVGGVITLSDDDHMLLGNPSAATTDTTNHDNYLMVKQFFTLSYNRTRAIPNWVSWHLNASDLDTFSRSNDFRQDSTLPQGWFRACKTCYQNTGFDRGHNCPSADRTASVDANSATFLMTNMFPQAPNMNSERWANMEAFERSLIQQGNEAYIMMGTFGVGGTGDSGTRNTIKNGKITVPSNVWKIIVVLPDGTNDLSRITTSTRIIAVIMPNKNNHGGNWKPFRTSVDAIEVVTGYDLLSNLPFAIQQVIEARIDDQ